MAKGMNRLSSAANRSSSRMDYAFVAKQLGAHGAPVRLRKRLSAIEIDKETRNLINWAKDRGVASIFLMDRSRCLPN
jgi:hypothetical protein